jgi:hypothetical protein
MLPIELVDLICEKINRKILVAISFIESNIKYSTNLFYILNRNRLEKYWNGGIRRIKENNDVISLVFIWYNFPEIKF